MSILHVHDEQEVEGIIDFMDPQYPTTVWYAGADDGHWELCVRTTIDGVSYFDAIDENLDPGDDVTITVKRRRLRLARKWKIVEATMGDTIIWLRPVIRR